MKNHTSPLVTREVLYVAMFVLLAAIFCAAYWGAPPIYIAVGFVAEIILVATAHLSWMIQEYGAGVPSPNKETS